MNELIKINSIIIGDEKANSVDARSLWSELESKQEFSHWISAKVLINPFFEENVDYIVLGNIIKNLNGGRPRKDYALKLNSAKKVAMAEQTSKGDKVRDYFIRCEAIAHGSNVPGLSDSEKYLTTKAHLDLELFVQDQLRASDASKLMIIHSVYEDHGVPTKYLPQYTEKVKVTFAAKDLLEKNECGISTIAFNKLMVSAEYMEVKERTASKGKTKSFKALTEQGMEYGQNDASKHNPRETQPHYFEDSFMELFGLINL